MADNTHPVSIEAEEKMTFAENTGGVKDVSPLHDMTIQNADKKGQ
jgi:hypothetical protein